MNMKPEIMKLKKHYYHSLFEDVVPWWEKHSIDTENGGFFTRLERDGRPYSGDKDMWMTGREIWIFAHLYNQCKKEESWKKHALHGLDFMLKYAMKENGKMFFRLDKNGKPLAEVLSLFTEVFAAIAVAECAKMTADEALRKKADAMYDFLIPRLMQTSDTPTLAYPLIDTQIHLHSHDMCCITVAKVYDDIWPSQKYKDAITQSINSIIEKHWKPDLNCFLENVAADGSTMFHLPEGRLFHPGHAIESAWMIMEAAKEKKDDALFNVAVDILLASLNHGWDREYGGLRYMTNIDWTPCHSLEADLKLWWPHAETLYALLLAWIQTERDDLKSWYDVVHDYTFSKFPDKDFGEWYGYLNRDGSKVWTAKANGWKGMFHLPRVLFRSYQLLASTMLQGT